LSLAGRTAIITGASRGLGAVIARRFVEAGASVLLVARDGCLLRPVCERLAELVRPGQQVRDQAGDVTSPECCAAAVRRAQEMGGALTVLVNNAGVQGPIGPLDAVPWEEWVETVRINLCGTALMCRAVLPVLRAHGYGKIVNLSGGGAAGPRPNFSAYAAAKAAVVRLTETLAEEVRDARIDVNAIAPGALNTRMLDEVLAVGPERAGAAVYAQALKQRDEGGAPPERAAALAEFLASAASDGITGRLLSAGWDDWAGLPRRREQLALSDVFTLRRIVPADRGWTWQCA
jgi:3-oxoacyl-[acyl-carrier protein] reductase